MRAVVVVESPAKAKTIERYLGKEYKVLASYGHVRAYPKKDGSVDPEHDFAMRYQIIDDKQKRIDAIVKALKPADTLILASDLDREGEAIAWHVQEVLKEKGALEGKAVQRITFHEITKKAICEAVAHPRDLNMPLVDAQQARSALDYLVGFTLSPLLWRKVRSGLSAGRVQSVALRLICDREQHIRDFKPKEYWTVETQCGLDKSQFPALLHTLKGKKLAKFDLPDAATAKRAATHVNKGRFTVADIVSRQRKQQPAPPFITSTLQMDAARKLGFTARKTMQIAQKLYEGLEMNGELVGLITYMRTDSVSLSEDALTELRAVIGSRFGQDYLPARARRFKTKSKNAQEAHEAIRPTHADWAPDHIKAQLEHDQWRLYQLIWQRSIASQMNPALLDQVTADLQSEKTLLRATGSTLTFAGFRAVYTEGSDEPSKKDDERMLPALSIGMAIDIHHIEPKQHFTEPKPRFSEASLVKELEQHGIGRPSTYASILNVLRERHYVEMDKKRFKPTDVGEIVTRFLCNYFSDIVDTKFTGSIEEQLDAIARGEVLGYIPLLRSFWDPFKAKVDDTMANVSRADVTHEATEEVCDKCQKPMAIKLGRYGKFLACTGYPECKNAKPLNDDGEQAAPETEPSDEICDKCQSPMVIKKGRYGKFLGCSTYPDCRNIQPLEKPKDTGICCPECGKGHLLEKRSRRGKIFFSCAQYPKCKYALWNKPIATPCPKCSHAFVTEKVTKRNGTEHLCPAEGCDWKISIEAPES